MDYWRVSTLKIRGPWHWIRNDHSFSTLEDQIKFGETNLYSFTFLFIDLLLTKKGYFFSFLNSTFFFTDDSTDECVPVTDPFHKKYFTKSWDPRTFLLLIFMVSHYLLYETEKEGEVRRWYECQKCQHNQIIFLYWTNLVHRYKFFFSSDRLDWHVWPFTFCWKNVSFLIIVYVWTFQRPYLSHRPINLIRSFDDFLVKKIFSIQCTYLFNYIWMSLLQLLLYWTIH